MTSPKQTLLAYHRREQELDDEALDEVLGLPPQRYRSEPERDTRLQRAHPGESIINVATPYEVCRMFVEALSPSADDLIVDLGCGMGRLLLYVALCSPARLRGIEMVAERVEVARRCSTKLGLDDRVSVIGGNVLDQPLDEGTIFYLFRPFSVETEERILARLHEQARRRPVTVVTHRLQPSLFDREVFVCESLATPQIYRSRID